VVAALQQLRSHVSSPPRVVVSAPSNKVGHVAVAWDVAIAWDVAVAWVCISLFALPTLL
jgi:hypothetical protein